MKPVLKLDHIVVSAGRLQDGIEYVQDTLGVLMAPGGKHALMGTHNALLGLGESYLEVIAIDPDAPDPGRPRWFDLDNFEGAPRLTNWVAGCSDLNATLAVAPSGSGTPMQLSRGDLSWTIAVADNGKLPFGGAFPGFIDWGDAAHPSGRLPDAGCRITRFDIIHPDVEDLRRALGEFDGGMQDWVTPGPLGFAAQIGTPDGPKVLL